MTEKSRLLIVLSRMIIVNSPTEVGIDRVAFFCDHSGRGRILKRTSQLSGSSFCTVIMRVISASSI